MSFADAVRDCFRFLEIDYGFAVTSSGGYAIRFDAARV